MSTRSIYAHEAFVRGPNGESAFSVLLQVTDANRYAFDQACRVGAIRDTSEVEMNEMLSINFFSNAVYRPEACIRSAFAAEKLYRFPGEKIIFELTEYEQIHNRANLVNIFREYQRFRFSNAIDDFGARYAGLDLLAEYQPNIIKINMTVVRDIDTSKPKQAIVLICPAMDVRVLAEGIETIAERDFLQNTGIHLMQGYLFCKPTFQALGIVDPASWA
ncbi:MAG: EAL domain-containing protein [Glaciimonas sp.]|nr:EAL domain-containing protein [Glaciimonas sp.]